MRKNRNNHIFLKNMFHYWYMPLSGLVLAGLLNLLSLTLRYSIKFQ